MKLVLFLRLIWHSAVSYWLAFVIWRRRRRLVKSFVQELQKQGFSSEEVLWLSRGLDLNDLS